MSRKKIPADERLKLWVRSGGRCALCKKYLLEGELTLLPLFLGESAHMVGQQDNEASPRGKAALPALDRDLADNLILLCPDDHAEIDKKLATGLVTIDWLTEQKHEHETWIREVTGHNAKRETAILRMVADVRGRSVELGVETAVSAVVRTDARYPRFTLSPGNAGIEIDLRPIPGEPTPTAAYWQMCRESIDDTIEHKLVEAVRRGIVKHVSVFAFARLPLLVYLGSRLDDTYEVEVYQRQRSDESWGWPGTDAAAFTTTRSAPAGPEAVFDPQRQRDDRSDRPPRGGPGFAAVYGGDRRRIGSRCDHLTGLARAFEAAVRGLFASLEEGGKKIRRLHVFAALPISAAVVLGRAHDRHVHPTLALYDRTGGGYNLAMEVSS